MLQNDLSAQAHQPVDVRAIDGYAHRSRQSSTIRWRSDDPQSLHVKRRRPTREKLIPKLSADNDVNPAPRGCCLKRIIKVLHPDERRLTCPSGPNDVELRMKPDQLDWRTVVHVRNLALRPARGARHLRHERTTHGTSAAAFASNKTVVRRTALALSVVFGVVLAACTSSHATKTPRQTVVAYFAAVARHDREEASSLVCPRFVAHPFVFKLGARHGIVPELTPTTTRRLRSAHWVVDSRLRYGSGPDTSGPPIAVQQIARGHLCVRALISHG